MSQLEFDENVAKQLEAIYARRDARRRRALVLAALAPQPGEQVIDVGCGHGLYVTDILDAVGAEGAVTGVDGAEPMLAIARARTSGRENVTFHHGDAAALPAADGSFDAAVSVQVLEYIADVPAVLREMHRVLRPGGRVVIWDVDWATVSWRSDDPARMRRVLDAWDRHLTHRSLPQTLVAQLRDAGFPSVELQAHPFATAERDPEAYGGWLTDLIAEYAADQGGLDAEEVAAWKAEQEELDARGEFFFSVTQFCFIALRSA